MTNITVPGMIALTSRFPVLRLQVTTPGQVGL